LETDLTSNASRVSSLETDFSALETEVDSNAARVGTLETDLTSNASRVTTLETYASSNASRVGVLETDLASNATRTGVLETDLTSNASRVTTLETFASSNAARVGVLETDLASNATRVSSLETDLSALETDVDSNTARVGVLETDLTSNATRVGVLETDLASNASRVTTLESSVSTLDTDLSADISSNAVRVGVLETDLASNASRTGVLETDLASNASRVSSLETDLSALETDVDSNTARVGVLETDLASNATRVTTLETDLASNDGRTTVLETDLTSNAARVDTLESDVSALGTRMTAEESNVITLQTDLASNATRVATLESSLAATTLQDVTDSGNTTTNVVQFTNSTTGLVTTANIEVGSNISIAGLVDAVQQYVPMTQTDGFLAKSPIYVTSGGTTVLSSAETEIYGNLTLRGETTIVNSTEVTIQDRIFGIGQNNTVHNLDTGIILEHMDDGEFANVGLIYHADEHRFSVGYTANSSVDTHVLSLDDDPTHRMLFDVRGNLVVQNDATFIGDVMTQSNVGIMNAAPIHTLDVGSNLYVDDTAANVLVVGGNAVADYFIGDGSLLTGINPTIEDVLTNGNVASSVIHSTASNAAMSAAGGLVTHKRTGGYTHKTYSASGSLPSKDTIDLVFTSTKDNGVITFKVRAVISTDGDGDGSSDVSTILFDGTAKVGTSSSSAGVGFYKSGLAIHGSDTGDYYWNTTVGDDITYKTATISLNWDSDITYAPESVPAANLDLYVDVFGQEGTVKLTTIESGSNFTRAFDY
jgi:predicted RNase H-like nuclease (RuvC/YqgF family)